MSSLFDGLAISHHFADLPSAFHTAVPPQPLANSRLLHVNKELAAQLGLDVSRLGEQEFLDVVSGQAPLPGGLTVSAVYSGHQFGVWAGQLGDGRAHLLGQIDTPTGPQELQLKGAGKTPYSRMGDGRAVLRSSVREYLASEAMAGLGIATSRALALVTSDTPVYRETVETGAIVTRVAPSFVRFGSFEHWANDASRVRELLDYVLREFYPELLVEGDSEQERVCRFLQEVTHRSAEMVADWQTVGFCHGVMNTDNMSILGLTIDYGPYGFMDRFRVNHVCNHSDNQGRYAWNAQPAIVHWNLYRLASALMVLDPDVDAVKEHLQTFEASFLKRYHANLQAKFGLRTWQADDAQLVDDWWRLLHNSGADFTLSFRALAQASRAPEAFLSLFEGSEDQAQAWWQAYSQRLTLDGSDTPEQRESMNRVNPLYVLRNHLAEQAIQAAAKDDASEIDTLLKLLRDPYTERAGFEAYAMPPPEGSAELAVSCSS
ncbi:YdiU family protein [Alcaligenes sp. YSL9]|uniref:protein adenylyltransferase SelO n=1 Tax=Alcaligenes sp. YSL9 TaxID=2939596 RepID=UPI00266C3DA0|nr:YdiU family protein [Alcaligenes sp. YSL9]